MVLVVTFWDIISTYVKLLNNINSNMLVLIPEKPGYDALQDFRPFRLAAICS